MRHILAYVGLVLLLCGGKVPAQGRDVHQVLAEARNAIGANALDALKTLTATGRNTSVSPNGDTIQSDFELLIELPDRYLMRTVVMKMGSASIYRNSGFSRGQLIDYVESPPSLAGGVQFETRLVRADGSTADRNKMTQEQKIEFDTLRLVAKEKEFAQLALGMLASPLAAYPLEMTYAGKAEAADGKAEAIDLKGEGAFAARLFVDAQTHLPLMLTWMDKEPVNPLNRGMSEFEQQRDRAERDAAARRPETETKRRVVEFRVFYSDYKKVGGLTLPHRVQRFCRRRAKRGPRLHVFQSQRED